jgi:hypothetical protein
MDLQAKDWLPPVIGLAGGAFAGLIAAMSAVIGKENKISEFRQAWIDDQREDLALIAAEAVAYGKEPDAAKKVERLAVFDGARARIELRENPIKGEWTQIRSEIGALRDRMIAADTSAIAASVPLILAAARLPLKANWTIVKNGEPWYRYFKNALVVAIIATVTLGVTAALWLGPTGPYLRPRTPTPRATLPPFVPPSPTTAGNKTPAPQTGKTANGR